jgi:hypothetical protein
MNIQFQYFRAQNRAQARRIQNRCSLLVGSSRFSTKFVECPVVDNVPDSRCKFTNHVFFAQAKSHLHVPVSCTQDSNKNLM